MTREELIHAATLATIGHDYAVRAPGDWVNLCTGCDWEVVGPVELHDEHLAELALDAVEHLIRADALRGAADEIGRQASDPALVERAYRLRGYYEGRLRTLEGTAAKLAQMADRIEGSHE